MEILITLAFVLAGSSVAVNKTAPRTDDLSGLAAMAHAVADGVDAEPVRIKSRKPASLARR